jgi:hypothetical protein
LNRKVNREESGDQRNSPMLQGLANNSSRTGISLRVATSNRCGLAIGTRSPGLRYAYESSLGWSPSFGDDSIRKTRRSSPF